MAESGPARVAVAKWLREISLCARVRAIVEFKDLDELKSTTSNYTLNQPTVVITISGELYIVRPSQVCHICKRNTSQSTSQQRFCASCFMPRCDDCTDRSLPCTPVDQFKLSNMIKPGLNICEVCGELAKQYCSHCQFIAYCSAQCQRQDWPRHRKQCMECYRVHESLMPRERKIGSAYCIECGEPWMLSSPFCPHAVVDARWKELRAKKKAAAAATRASSPTMPTPINAASDAPTTSIASSSAGSTTADAPVVTASSSTSATTTTTATTSTAATSEK